MKIAVLGAGAVGLSTAVNIQNSIEGAEVTVLADKFTVDTTSDGAAGIFRPREGKSPDTPLHLLRKYLQTSWEHLNRVYLSEDAIEAGVTIISGYSFYHTRPGQLPTMPEFTYQFAECSQRECEQITAEKFSFGYKYTTLICEPRKYLPYLTKKFQSNGGTIISLKRKLQSLSELVGRYDIVVNCTGYGSKDLLGDTSLVPDKGHLIRVAAPWIKNFIYFGETHIIPGQDNVIIGWMRQSGVDNLEIKPEDSNRIWNSAVKLVPSLKRATRVREWVGIRPCRNALRVEAEEMKFPQGNLKVVHNYGHGSEGISLSWGTAVEAAGLVRGLLDLPPAVQAHGKSDTPAMTAKL